MNIKSQTAAGNFYLDNREKLLKQLSIFEKNNSHDYNYKTRAIIVPHAGYVYSGQLASNAFQYLNKNIQTVFVIAPPHYVPVNDISLSSFDTWETPLGKTGVNNEINDELNKIFGYNFQAEAFEQEHSIEVQIPFIQHYLPNAKIVPILTNNIKKTKEIISNYWSNPKNGFVISSDLSHFNESENAKKIDKITAEMIETKNSDNFSSTQACGAVGICALVDVAKEKNYSLIRIGMYNSGDVTGENSKVVGYGSWILYEGEKNGFIKKYFSNYVIDVCKKSILARLDNENLTLENIPAVFLESGASFVTLEKNDDLRGCIGSIIAHRALINDLAQNAQNSAFSDPRFQPLKKDEFKDLSINVSLLSSPQKMSFKDEQDLLIQIRPNIDGIIIKDGNYQSVYLPSVWEQIPEKEFFLESLKIKAGMSPKHFSPTFEAYKYTTEYIKSE
jgi:MEMO1 family protein